jgi:CheY-like chemotaxis protein
VETVVEPETPRIQADATQFHQVLINLVTNALQAVATQGGKIRIGVGPAFIRAGTAAAKPALGRYCRLSVSDNGSGIDPDLRSRIFDPFFTTKGPGSGTGLGLSVVHGIVNAHGGFIEVDSQPGQGSCFHVYFPAVESAESRPEPVAELPVGRGEEILILDDELLLLDALRRLLEKRNYRPVVVSRPEMALAALENPAHRIRLAILDYAMPGSSGLDVAALLVKSVPGLPIILVSGNPGGVSVEAARSVGIREIFTKPVRTADILPALSRLLTEEPPKP